MPITKFTAALRSLALGLFAALAPASLAEPAAPAAPAQKPKQPNIILILSDDCGYADFGFQDVVAPDMKGRTPAMDALAKAGTVFTQAHSSGLVCSPTRAGLMTGRYQQSFGHENNLPAGSKLGLPLTETTLPQRLAQLGYTTEAFGKWHLGYEPAYHPNARGYGHFYGFLQGSRSYHPYGDKVSANHVFLDNRQATPETGYVTDRIGDAAVAGILRHAKEGKPFFQYVAFSAAHGPLQPRHEDADWVAALPAKGGRAKYIGLMKGLDENVAKIVAAVNKAGIADNTLIVLTNDNGGQTQVGANNGILRGHKGEIWEGGSRVPMVAFWPGHVPAGARIGETVTTLDLPPTLLDAAGMGAPPENFDGASLLPRLTGKIEKLPETPHFWRMGGPKANASVKLGSLKLVQERHDGQSTPRLFDLAADPSEKNDLAAARPQDVKRLAPLLAAWEKTLPKPLWGSGDNADDAAETSAKKGRKKP